MAVQNSQAPVAVTVRHVKLTTLLPLAYVVRREGNLFSLFNGEGGGCATACGLRSLPWSLVLGPFFGGRGGTTASDPRSFPRGRRFPSQDLPLARAGTGYPLPPPEQHMPQTGYAAGGTPFAVTQDFLVGIKIRFVL